MSSRSGLLFAALVAACFAGTTAKLSYCSDTTSVFNQSQPDSPNNCFLATNLYPRTCQCVLNDCPSTGFPNQDCFICNRGTLAT